jgi:hypothetical protein
LYVFIFNYLTQLRIELQAMSIIETIKNRKSCRTFNVVMLNPADKSELERYIIENKKLIGDETINLSIVEKNCENKKMKLDYGMIQGHNTYILGTSKSEVNSRVNYGYLMEKVVLKATEIGLSTCWIGIFDENYFNEITVEKGYVIPSIVIVGYSKERQTNLDKFVRFNLKATKRFGWEKLFFNYSSETPLTPDRIGKYSDSIEMVRLAPSSGNTQPWRIFFDDRTNEFHFFKKPINKKYEEKGLHDIDLGIALAHFELTSLHNSLSGNWIKYKKEEINSFDERQYIMTWKCS